MDTKQLEPQNSIGDISQPPTSPAIVMSASPYQSTTRRAAIFLALFDVIAFIAVIPIAIGLRHGFDIPYGIVIGYTYFGPILILWRIVAATLAGVYDFRLKFTWIDHAFAGGGAALFGVLPGYFLLALVQIYGFSDVRVSRLIVLFEILLLIAWFALSRGIALSAMRAAGRRPSVLLVGDKEASAVIAHEIEKHGGNTIDIDDQLTPDDDIATQLIDRSPSHVILAQSDLPHKTMHATLHTCFDRGIEIYLYPPLDQAALMMGPVVSLAGVPLIPLQQRAGSVIYRTTKRTMDITAAAVLLVLTSPLLLIATVAIALTSPGGIIFTQERVGWRGRPFRVYKLRTMRADAEAESGPILAKEGDARITLIGGMLRRWRIDEIPQLWNVIRGEMSLVGPRPERQTFVDQFLQENPLYERRLAMRPGLTGLAQIHGRYDTDYAQKLRYDLLYINSASTLQDLRILLATIQTVLTARGAL